MNPMPPSQAHPCSDVQLTPAGSSASRSPTAASANRDPQRLANDKSQDHRDGHASAGSFRQTHARVRERKERMIAKAVKP